MRPPQICVLILLLLLPFAVSGAPSTDRTKSCKCRPSLPCWPSNAEWKQFNSTLGGMLVAHIRPISSACYEGTPEYNKQRCDEVTKNYGDSAWRANQAGDLQNANWETYYGRDRDTGAILEETCYLPSLLSNKTGAQQCKQGSIPQYGVRARNAQDISTAVKFASKHKLPIVIKNTGHDFLGRSSRRNALMIWTHFMNEISFENDYGGWKPAGCSNSYTEKDLLVKAGAGVMVFELTKEASKRGRTVVVGADPTVGVAGGYIQGGGHSPLGVWKGLASDHAVEFEVVFADGTIAKVSPCSHPDLFWALRGGGGSTFGVVTSVTLRTHENVSMVQYTLNVTIPIIPTNPPTKANETFWELVTRWHTMAPALNDLGGSGYYYLVTNYPLPGFNVTGHIFVAYLFFAGQQDTQKVEELFKPLDDWMYKTIGSKESGLVSQRITPAAPATDYFGTLPSTSGGGGISILGSRLISRELLSTPNGVKRVTDALSDINYLGGLLLGHYVTPGPKPVDSAAHSAWRKAITHIVVVNGWEPGESFAKQNEIKALMTDKLVPRLKQLDRVDGKQTMGAYVNEADKLEKDWQNSFWGEKYGRLLKIKEQYDPQGVFWCTPCVGSELWDSEGLCKLG